MNKLKTFELILRNRIFQIPSNLPYMNDANSEIISSLMLFNKYVVKSKVTDEVFKTFIDHWINNQIPIICKDNIFEYETISKEFDQMKNLIEIFKKKQQNDFNSSLSIINRTLKIQKDELKEKFISISKIYNQAIYLLFNNPGINSHSDFIKVKSKLYEACKTNNINLIYNLTRKKIENEYGLVFSLNEEDQTANVLYDLRKENDILIPKSIYYQSQEFVVKSVLEESFKNSKQIDSIQFSEDSEVQSICQGSFECSNFRSLSIPSSLTQLEDGWCRSLGFLNKISISPKNKSFIYFENSFILGKYWESNKNYDVLIFARRDIESAIIPPFIKHISSYSFAYCRNLTKIEFLPNSQLETVGSFAFYLTSIEYIKIPQHVNKIDSYAFYGSKLKTVEFAENCELKIIDDSAFSFTNIQRIMFPSSITHIMNNAFCSCNQLDEIDFEKNSNLRFIGSYAFRKCSIKSIKIPQFVTVIQQSAFRDCKNLKEVIFSKESELVSIENNVFCNCPLENIVIPSKVVELQPFCFFGINNLNSITLESIDNSFYCYYNDSFILKKSHHKNKYFDVLFIARKNIEVASIPSFIKHISSCAFHSCSKLNKIEFPNDSKLESIGEESFYCSSLKQITIPSHVNRIGDSAFYSSKNLQKIEFAEKSNLKSIGKSAFYETSIEHIIIPASVNQIDDCSFKNCTKLKTVDYQEESNLRTLNNSIFYNTSIESLTIPSNVIELKQGWYCMMQKLNHISISPKNNNFFYFNNSMLLGKSSPNSRTYDVLILIKKRMKKIIIPSFIKIILGDAIRTRKSLKEISFLPDSKLKEIKKRTFSYASIKSITIPSNVESIKNSAFEFCKYLKFVDFDENSKLRIIETNAFANTSINSICIPSNVRQIGDKAFFQCIRLKIIEFDSNSELLVLGTSTFFLLDKNCVILAPHKLEKIFKSSIVVW